MCGICGELSYSNNPTSVSPEIKSSIKKMAQRLKRRGPDGEGFLALGPLQFGHCRLSIIDLSTQSDQPLRDAKLGVSIVFNGTLFNYRELRLELQKHNYQFSSQGDTEVILKAYHFWKNDCVHHFRGVFAFAIWDQVEKKLFLARDRLGIKPLYYTEVSDKLFRFASTLPALLEVAETSPTIAPKALHFHFHLHAVVPAPQTILNGISKLGPGEWLEIKEDGSRTLQKYWKLKASRTQERSESEWIDLVSHALLNAINRERRAADVPVGVLLSGGLDSSLIVALLAQSGEQDIPTFSIGFEPVGLEKSDEFEFSDRVARQFGTSHIKYSLPNSAIMENLVEAIGQMSEPMVSTDVTAFFLLAQRVAQKIKVVLSGQGADELFAGYFWYSLMEKESGKFIDRFKRHYFDRSHQEYLSMINPEFHSELDETSRFIAEELNSSDAESFLDAVLRLDLTCLIVDDPVKRVDNMTMAWGLDARVPFLDHELVELAMQIPPALKLQGGGKYPLKVIARKLLPAVVIDRPKGYFPVPVLKHLQGPLNNLITKVLDSEPCRARNLYNRSYIDHLKNHPENLFTPIQGNKLWHLTLLELWLQANGIGGK